MNETIKSSEKRIQAIDIAKGILIVCVVIGHGSENDSLSNFVYRFHMPLFLILSGCFVRKTDDIRTWIKARTIRYMLPYFFYMLIDFVFFDRVHNINRLLHYLWGGAFYQWCLLVYDLPICSINYYGVLNWKNEQKRTCRCWNCGRGDSHS